MNKLAFRTLKWFYLDWCEGVGLLVSTKQTYLNSLKGGPAFYVFEGEQEAFQWLEISGYIEPIVNKSIEVPND